MDREDKANFDIYEKLFWGNNLPTVTPAGKTYVPVWTQNELERLRSVMAYGIDNFHSHSAVI